jgi:REP element-mobilizing transposase RayT
MHLPHFKPFSKQPLLFLTTCVAGRRPLLANDVAQKIMSTIWAQSAAMDGWNVGRYVLMPDHVHFFAVPTLQGKPLAEWMKLWKSVSARRLVAVGVASGPVWQASYFDHFVRSADAYVEKWEYVRRNPARQGLCLNPDDWPYQGIIHHLEFRI